MKDYLSNNYGNIIVITILVILIAFVINKLCKNGNKCAYCSHANNCPIKKVLNKK